MTDARRLYLAAIRPVGPYRTEHGRAEGTDQFGNRIVDEWTVLRPLWRKRKPQRRLKWRRVRNVKAG